MGPGLVAIALAACGRLGFDAVATSDDDAGTTTDADVTSGATSGLGGGSGHTCATTDAMALRCWGAAPALGYGGVADVGDDETPASVGDVPLTGEVVEVATGSSHTCVRLATGSVRCWGRGPAGELGYAATSDVPSASAATDVDLGGVAVQVVAGAQHTCARLDSGAVRCWGAPAAALGYGSGVTIGDNETPASAGDVPIGGAALEIVAGGIHTCARLAGGRVRCWGAASDGQLGYGDSTTIGDDEPAGAAGDVPLGGAIVVELAAGYAHTCARFDSGAVRCWGYGMYGQLGTGQTANVGDDELATEDAMIGAAAVGIAAGGDRSCARLGSGAIRCWGAGGSGALGYASTTPVSVPASAGDVDVGGAVVELGLGFYHTCARLAGDAIRCWGSASGGALGYGDGQNIGDDESPATAGDVPYR